MQQPNSPQTEHNRDKAEVSPGTQMVVFNETDNQLALFNATPPPEALLQQLEAIKQNNIASSTQNQYLAANCNLVIFLFHHY